MDQVLHVFEADLSRFRLLGQAAIEALRLYRRNWSVVLLARKSAIQICVMFEEL